MKRFKLVLGDLDTPAYMREDQNGIYSYAKVTEATENRLVDEKIKRAATHILIAKMIFAAKCRANANVMELEVAEELTRIEEGQDLD